MRDLVVDMGGEQVGTVGSLELEPNLVNVIARRARLTIDLRNTDQDLLGEAEARMMRKARELAASEQLELQTRQLARFAPVDFHEPVIAAVERIASAMGHSARRMASGAGHDAQSFAPNCPTGIQCRRDQSQRGRIHRGCRY